MKETIFRGALLGLAVGAVAAHGKVVSLVPEECALKDNAPTKPCFDASKTMNEKMACLITVPPIFVAPGAPHCFAEAEEIFRPTRYCIASNGTVGGWGMRLDSAVDVVPSQIVQLQMNATAYATTDPKHIFSQSEFPVIVGVIADKNQNVNKTIIRRCAIEGAVGPLGILQQVTRDKDAGEVNVTLTVKGEEFANDNTIIPAKQLMFEVVGKADELSNKGPVPPALMKTSVSMKHRLRLSQVDSK